MESISSLDAETKRMVESALGRFVDEAYEPSERHKRLLRGALDYRAHWSTLAELGVLSLSVSESFGGIGGSTKDVSDALRVLARGLVLEPLIEAGVIPMVILAAGPNGAEAVEHALSGESLTVLIGGRRGDQLHCVRERRTTLVSGMARVVPGAAQADIWLIACTGEEGESLIYRIRPSELKAGLKSYRMMDAREACDIEFDSCVLPPESLWLSGAVADQALKAAALRAIAAYCADAAGVMQCLVQLTGEYLRTRIQFDSPLASFQALQHRLADMHMSALEARSMARAVATSIDAGDAPQMRWLSYAAPTVLSRCSSRVGHDAIQLHGGMGVTDELIISHYNSRLVVIQQMLVRWMTDAQTSSSSSS